MSPHVHFQPMDPAEALDLGLQVGILPTVAERGTIYALDELAVEEVGFGFSLIGDPIPVEPEDVDPEPLD